MMTLPCVPWKYKQLVLDENTVLHAVFSQYINEAIASIIEIETEVRYMCESSAHWAKAQKEYKGEE